MKNSLLELTSKILHTRLMHLLTTPKRRTTPHSEIHLIPVNFRVLYIFKIGNIYKFEDCVSYEWL